MHDNESTSDHTFDAKRVSIMMISLRWLTESLMHDPDIVNDPDWQTTYKLSMQQCEEVREIAFT